MTDHRKGEKIAWAERTLGGQQCVKRLAAEASKRAGSQFAKPRDLEGAQKIIGFFWEGEGISSKELFADSPRGPLAGKKAKPVPALVPERSARGLSLTGSKQAGSSQGFETHKL